MSDFQAGVCLGALLCILFWALSKMVAKDEDDRP